MKKYYFVIVIICLVFTANFIFLSVGFGQPGVNIGGYVPLTSENHESTLNSINDSSVNIQQVKFKENKYLYYFEKASEEKSKKVLVQTDYDKFSSYGLMVLVLIIFAIILLLLLHFNEKFWRNTKIKSSDLKI